MFSIPLQSAGADRHAYTEQTLYKTLANLFAYVFLDFDTMTSFALRAAALKETKELGKIVQRVVEKTRHDNFETVMKHLGLSNGMKQQALQDFGTNLIKRLSEDGKSVDEVVWTIIPTAAAAVATQAQAVHNQPSHLSRIFPTNVNLIRSPSFSTSTSRTNTSPTGPPSRNSPNQTIPKTLRN